MLLCFSLRFSFRASSPPCCYSLSLHDALPIFQVRIGQTWIYTQKLFEKCILVCSYFLMINMILSNLNLPTANLGKLMESNINFFYLVFPALTTGLVGMIFMYIIIPSIFMVISPTRFKDRFK